MAKTTKRNRKPVQKVDILNLPEGVYLDEKGFGEYVRVRVWSGKKK